MSDDNTQDARVILPLLPLPASTIYVSCYVWSWKEN